MIHKKNKIVNKPFFLIIFFTLLVISLAFSIILAVHIGSVFIDFNKIAAMILNSIGFNIKKTWTNGEENIILVLRLPRVLMAACVGAMLAVAGVVAQGIFKNPIVDPYIIGISSSAGFGAALSVVLGIAGFLSVLTVPLVSFFFSCMEVFIIFNLSKTKYHLSMSALLLSGIALSYFFGAFTSFILYFSEEHAHYILTYMMGSFWGSSWTEFFFVFIILLNGTIILIFYGRDLNAMVLGDSSAQSLGINVEHSKRVTLIIMTLLTSTSVAFCGSIGFVGLVIPHLMRMIVGSDHKKLLIFSAIGGGLLLVWADLVARTIFAPLELPVGILTSLIGGPFFVYIIIKKKKAGELL